MNAQPKAENTPIRSNRQGNNRIRGPHSALTDFLAANNISAARIRADFHRRRLQAEQQDQQDQDQQQQDQQDDNASAAGSTTRRRSSARRRTDDADVEMENTDGVVPTPDSEEDSDSSPRTKRRKLGKAKIQFGDDDEDEDDLPSKGKGKAKKGKGKEKASKGKGKGKGKKKKPVESDDSDGDDSDNSDDLFGLGMSKKAKKLPGQLEYCELCGKRFTVTPYSRTGPDGGLLCTPCGKAQKDDEAKSKKKAPKPAVTGKRRRKVESEKMDGRIGLGAKSLLQLCIEKIVQHADDIEGFGDMSEPLLQKLSHIFTKNRVLKPDTLDLFLRRDNVKIEIHDAAYLETEHYNRIFMECPQVEDVALTNVCQFKDENLRYLLEKGRNVKYLKLYGANLVTTDMWNTYLTEHGSKLEHLKLSWLNASFDDSTLEVLSKHCKNLTRLKLEQCSMLSDTGLEHLKNLPKLAHLTLNLIQPLNPKIFEAIVAAHGSRLETLCLSPIPEATDTLLTAISTNCTKLAKLRLTDAENLSDAGIAAMFDDLTGKNPPLTSIDMNSTRSVDNVMPDGPTDGAIGFASAGFVALMKHSGPALRELNISSCRHISLSAFSEVFGTGQTYPQLEDIDLSFCGEVDSYVVTGIFRSCPNLRKLVAFGCFEIEEVVVPTKVVLIGVPRAQDAIEQFGAMETDVTRGADGGLEVAVRA